MSKFFGFVNWLHMWEKEQFVVIVRMDRGMGRGVHWNMTRIVKSI